MTVQNHQQFEGFGAGDAWGSLGGVKDVDGDTYIVAETGAGDDNDELQFFTAGTEKMRIGATGDVSMGSRLDVAGDVSFNGDLTIQGNLNVLQQQNSSVITTTVNNYEVIISNYLYINGEVKSPVISVSPETANVLLKVAALATAKVSSKVAAPTKLEVPPMNKFPPKEASPTAFTSPLMDKSLLIINS